jgi:predicted ATPase
MRLHKDVWLRQYIVDSARGFTNCHELQEDCIQEAWMAISQAAAQRTIEWYANVARRAMNKSRMRENRYHKAVMRYIRTYARWMSDMSIEKNKRL